MLDTKNAIVTDPVEAVIKRRDAIVRRTVASLGPNWKIVADRKPIAEAGWDATYTVQFGERLFRVTDRAMFSEADLEQDIVRQVRVSFSSCV